MTSRDAQYTVYSILMNRIKEFESYYSPRLTLNSENDRFIYKKNLYELLRLASSLDDWDLLCYPDYIKIRDYIKSILEK